MVIIEESPGRDKAQRSGFGPERKSNGAEWSFPERLKADRGNGMRGVCSDEVGVD